MSTYTDPRIAEVEEQKQQALTNLEELYGGIIDKSDKYYEDQIQASRDWAAEQQQIQKEQNEFALQQIEQQKEKAEKDYQKEQSAAYVDYQKQTDRYGAGAEQMAASGLAGSGFSESSRVSMYNAYQNRVATAREAIQQALVDFNNAITQATLQNNAALAEIAASAHQQQLELQLQAFNYRNNLLLQKEEARQNYDNTYWQRHMNILDQINTERSLAIQASSLNSKNQTVISEQDKAYAQMILANNMLLDFQKTSGTYSDAVNVMKKYGLFEYASAPMTKNEWIRHGNKAADYNSYIESYMVNLSQKVEISIQ